MRTHMIDESVLHKIQIDLGIETLQELLPSFLENLKLSMIKINEAAQKKDLKNISFIAHSLKSSARTVGALYFAGICSQLEKLKNPEDIQQARLLISELLDSESQIRIAIEAYIKNQAAT